MESNRILYTASMRRARVWIKANLRIGALSFGGSGRSLLYQEEVVDRKKWLTEEEFFEVFTVAQLLPGPNLVNLAAYLTRRIFPARFWLAPLAVLALAVPGAFLAVFIVSVVDTDNSWVKTLFKGLSLGSIALFLVFIERLLRNVMAQAGWKRAGRLAVSVVVAVMSLTGVPLIPILLFGIGLGIAVEFFL